MAITSSNDKEKLKSTDSFNLSKKPEPDGVNKSIHSLRVIYLKRSFTSNLSTQYYPLSVYCLNTVVRVVDLTGKVGYFLQGEFSWAATSEENMTLFACCGKTLLFLLLLLHASKAPTSTRLPGQEERGQ